MHRRDIVRLGLVGGASLSVSALLRAHEPPFRIGALIPGPTTAGFLRPCGTACATLAGWCWGKHGERKHWPSLEKAAKFIPF
jgi:hypothetical protein